MFNKTLITTILSAPLLLMSASLQAEALSPEEFKTPQKNYKPKTWMHAMNGNLSKPGFTQDFKAMADAGIGGAIFFHVHRQNKPYSSRGPVRFGTEEFNDTLLHAIGEADKNGLEMGVHNADGWSSSGGPWITPEMSMKRITWSEEAISIKQNAGKKITVEQLKQPGFEEGLYQDIALIALPANEFNQSNLFANAKLSSSDPSLAVNLLKDNDWDTELVFTENKNNDYWLQVEVDQPTTLRSLQIETPSRHGEAALQISDDGVTFTTVVEKLRRPRTGARTWAFSPTFDGFTAKYFRFVFDKPIGIKRFDLWSVPRAPHWLAMNAMERGKLTLTPTTHHNVVTKAKDVLVLNRGELPKNGITLPKGNWRILRFGYTSTGAKNIPATVEGTGLECDKFDPVALQFHFEQYVGKLAKAAQAKGYKSLKTSEIDSYEMGGQNWTQGIDKTFKDKFNYDFIPWLPLITGRVIESPAHSGAILQEFRQHLADLMVENYFGEFTRLTKKYGMESYIEPYGWGPFDELRAGGKADRLMGEFWVRDEEYPGRVSAAISSAHIYGKNIISAESFTSINTVNWKGHPYFYKKYGDQIWARGINETMFHRFAHQPNNYIKPGMTMDSIGSHIDRTQTWWDNGGVEWFNYLARGSYLLQQGVPDADFLIHLGDLSSKGVPNKNNTKVPDGFNYDYVNSEVLIDRISVKDGWLVLPEGTRYRALQLFQPEHMRMKTLERIQTLVKAGATIISAKPTQPIGFSEWDKTAAFQKISNELWGDGQQALRKVGKGQISTLPLDKAIEQLGYQPDLKINGQAVKLFTHRRIGDNDLYFFYNNKAEFAELNVDIREGNGQPEIWHADNGSVEKITQFKQQNNRLTTKLLLEPHGSRFVLIRRDNNTLAYDSSHTALNKTIYQASITSSTNNKQLSITELKGGWQVNFDKNWSGPGRVSFDTLIDWTKHNNDSIKHFSGTANYHKTFNLSASQLATDQPFYLDLGDVQHIAEITVNGKKLATLWKPPFAVDISSAIKAGENTLQIDITNTWVNRLIGDEALPDTSGYSMTGDTVSWINNNERPPESERVTFTGYNFFKQPKSQVLEKSGLLGPVRLIHKNN
ncbi:glycosyl hydrolase [Thalassotalea agariperforans]